MYSWKSEMTSPNSAAFLLYMAEVVWQSKYKIGFGGVIDSSFSVILCAGNTAGVGVCTVAIEVIWHLQHFSTGRPLWSTLRSETHPVIPVNICLWVFLATRTEIWVIVILFHIFCKDKIDGLCFDFDCDCLKNNHFLQKHFVHIKCTCCR